MRLLVLVTQMGLLALEGFTIVFIACAGGAGLRGYDALSSRFGDGDHEIMNFLEVEVCHDGLVDAARK
jgi:hypothetical protein